MQSNFHFSSILTKILILQINGIKGLNHRHFICFSSAKFTPKSFRDISDLINFEIIVNEKQKLNEENLFLEHKISIQNQNNFH